jgi:hypothetical protein
MFNLEVVCLVVEFGAMPVLVNTRTQRKIETGCWIFFHFLDTVALVTWSSPKWLADDPDFRIAVATMHEY